MRLQWEFVFKPYKIGRSHSLLKFLVGQSTELWLCLINTSGHSAPVRLQDSKYKTWYNRKRDGRKLGEVINLISIACYALAFNELNK